MKDTGMKRIFFSLAFATAIVASTLSIGSTVAISAPVTLEGMGIVGQWTDFENQAGDLPAMPWGNSDTLGADRIGLHVEFAGGLTGTVTYSGVSSLWNSQFVGSGLPADTATGFFTTAERIHFLVNTGVNFPIAWTGFVMLFSNNFDLDYSESNGSNFRASTSGWESAIFTHYSSAGAVSAVPVPAALPLFGTGLAVLGFIGWRRKRKAA